MSYIRKVIGHNERLVLLTGLHWIYLLEAVLWAALIIAAGFTIERLAPLNMHSELYGKPIDLYFYEISPRYASVSFMSILMASAVFLVLVTKYLSTEIGLTDRRIIHKRGVIKIDVQQVELEDIRGEAIHHGWFGWLFGYGRVHFDCRFIDDIILPSIRNPYRVIKAVHTARMRSELIPHYQEKDLNIDIQRIDQDRQSAYKTHENLKKLGRLVKLDFREAGRKSRT
jgi:hypothetical protein